MVFRMNNKQIEEYARRLQVEVWKRRRVWFKRGEPHPLELLDPALFAEVLGVEYMELPDLGGQVFSFRGRNFQVAGLLDKQANRIAVSTAFSRDIIRFTAAHELGHWELHPGEVMHRDKALNGSDGNLVRPLIERQADYYAACLLIPEKLLRRAMKELFEVSDSLVFDGTTAFEINPQRADQLLAARPETLERELAIAKCTRFGGKAFTSLADTFGVSAMAMAIRLKELQLIEWP